MTTGSGRLAGGRISARSKKRAEAFVGRTLLDRYRVEELVAQGGLASVFRATKLATNEDVAVKILHPDAEGLPELIERFEREAVAGKHIFHPNVAAVMEFAQLEDGGYFLVQEFIRGRTLRDVMNEGPIEPMRAARIARELAMALNAAHDMHIVHRDVKPLNIMLLEGHDERVQLIDFGLAKVPVEHLAVANEDARRSLTQAGVVFGTVAYMAPEAALGMRAVDKRADLYALGVILYEMMAGKHPFTATDPAKLFAEQRNAVPPAVAVRAPGVVVPGPIERLVHKLLEKDPDERYPTARAVITAIDTALREAEGPQSKATAPLETAPAPQSVVPGAAPAPVSHPHHRRERVLLIVGVVLILFAISIAFWLVRHRRVAPPSVTGDLSGLARRFATPG